MRKIFTLSLMVFSAVVFAETKDVVMPCKTMYSGIQNLTVGDSITSSGEHLYLLRDLGRRIYTTRLTTMKDLPEDQRSTDQEFNRYREFFAGREDYVYTADELLNSVFSSWLKVSEFSILPFINFVFGDNYPETPADQCFQVLVKKNSELIYASEKDLKADQEYRIEETPAFNPVTDALTVELYRVNDEENKLVKAFNLQFMNDGDSTRVYNDEIIFRENEEKGLEGLYFRYSVKADSKLPALDAHWGMQQCYDAYKELFGRNSYDDNYADIYQLMDHSSGFDHINSINAFATHYKSETTGETFYSMTYGMGGYNGCVSSYIRLNPVVSLDVMAHEFTHLVTDFNGLGGLNYENESGALNESMSDCMAFALVNRIKGNVNNWQIGNDVMYDEEWCMRDLANPENPNATGQIVGLTTYKSSKWKDDADVHTNSAVPNRAYYLMCEGGSGINDLGDSYEVKAIGIEKAAQIAYHALTHYYSPDMTFLQARESWLKSATDLYGEDQNVYGTVANGWYAVGVGDAYPSGTGIDSVQTQTADSECYDLFGKKVTEQKGVVIKRGKIMIYR